MVRRLRNAGTELSSHLRLARARTGSTLDVLFGALVTWWPVLALLYVPRLAQLLAGALARHSRDALDHEIPDALPMTAGEWLAERLARLGYPIAALVTNEHTDGYRPGDRLIQLTDATYFKADPVFWVTAAHELGHARIHAEFPIVAALRAGATWLHAPLVAAGIGLAFGRVLHAMPIAGTLAFRCFAIAVALEIFTLLDEALASALAYREIGESDAITAVHRRAIRRFLATAFASYLVSDAAHALLLRRSSRRSPATAPSRPARSRAWAGRPRSCSRSDASSRSSPG